MKKTAKILGFIVLILVQVAIGGSLYYLYTQTQTLDVKISKLNSVDGLDKTANKQQVVATKDDVCGVECKKEIELQVSKAIANIPATTEKVTEKQTVVQKTTGGLDYISLGSTFSTTSSDWMNVDGSEVYIDLINDYGNDATVSWEASLKVAHGNGKAYARLWDDTNKIAVDYSEISSENNVDYEFVTTGKLPFWRGRNLYKVQIKSLNGFEVTYSNGKVRIDY